MARCDTLLGIRDNKLVTHIKIHRLNLTSKSDQIENIGPNILMLTVQKLQQNQEYNQLEQKHSAGVQLY